VSDRARVPLGVFLLSLGILLLTGSGRLRVIDEYMVWFQAETLMAEGDLAVPQAERLGVWYGRRSLEGRPQAPYGPLQAAVTAPWVPVGEAFARATGAPADRHDLLRPFPATHLASVALAAAAALLAGLALGLGASPGAAALLGLALAFGTSLVSYAGTLFSEPLAALLLLGALAALARATRPCGAGAPETASGGGARRWAALAGALVGAALLARPTHVIAAPAFGLGWLATAGAMRARLARAAAFSLPVVAAIGATLARNALLFGAPFDFGYPDEAELGTPINTFDTPWGNGLYGLLLSPGKSLLLYAPPVVLGLAGLGALWRQRRPLAIVAAVSLLTYVGFYARYGQWEGGYCFGPRYLLPVLPLVLVAAAPLLATAHRRARVTRAALAALFALGLATNLPAVATSFLEEQRGGGDYYDQRFDYRLDHGGALAQGGLALRYIEEALRDGPLATPTGTGLDLGPLHLRKAGASPRAVWLLVIGAGALALAGLALLVWPATARALRSSRSGGDRPSSARC
jgi:hypothetical protein